MFGMECRVWDAPIFTLIACNTASHVARVSPQSGPNAFCANRCPMRSSFLQESNPTDSWLLTPTIELPPKVTSRVARTLIAVDETRQEATTLR